MVLPGMRLFIGSPQIGRADVRVDLRGDQALVAQQFLHAANVGAAIQQVRGKAVPQRVGRGAPIETRFRQVLLQQPADAARRQSSAELVDEYRRFGCRPRLSTVREPDASNRHSALAA